MMKKYLSLFLSMVMLVSVLSSSAVVSYADDFEYTTISTNASWYQGYITDSNDAEWYKFSIPSDGTVTIKLMCYLYEVYFSLYNSDFSNRITGNNYWGGTPSSPKTETIAVDLSKGTYYIKISEFGDTGKFKLNASFKSFGANEKEPNDYEHAMTLCSAKEITGALTRQDDADWYKITLSSYCKINLKFIYYMDTVYFNLYNSDLSDCITGGKCWNGTPSAPKTKTFTADLSKGTYYIKVSKGDTGKYKLSWNINVKVSKPNDFRISTRKTTSLKLSWSKVSGASGYQLQRKSGDSYKTVANTSSTSYTVKSLSAGTGYTFRVRTYKTLGGKKYYSSWRTLSTVTKPAKPSIKTPGTNKKHQIIAKWKKVSKCTGYQVQYSRKKNFSSVIATKTVSGQSKTSYTGKNFTKGRTYYVRVRSYKTFNGTKYYSAWSSVKTIKCK